MLNPINFFYGNWKTSIFYYPLNVFHRYLIEIVLLANVSQFQELT